LFLLVAPAARSYVANIARAWCGTLVLRSIETGAGIAGKDLG
jgi:hypothetical protein